MASNPALPASHQETQLPLRPLKEVLDELFGSRGVAPPSVQAAAVPGDSFKDESDEENEKKQDWWGWSDCQRNLPQDQQWLWSTDDTFWDPWSDWSGYEHPAAEEVHQEPPTAAAAAAAPANRMDTAASGARRPNNRRGSGVKRERANNPAGPRWGKRGGQSNPNVEWHSQRAAAEREGWLLEFKRRFPKPEKSSATSSSSSKPDKSGSASSSSAW